MPEVRVTPDFNRTKGVLQSAEMNKVNEWVAAIEGGQDAFTAGTTVTKQIKKLQGKPPVAKGGTHEFCVGKVNRVFFKIQGGTVFLTAVGHT